MESDLPAEQPRSSYRPPWLLLAWLTPVLSPLAFALLLWLGVMKFLGGLLSRAIGGGQSMDLIGLFAMGWLCGTAVCGGYAAWRAAKKISEERIGRIAVFCLLWPVFAGTQAVLGASVGMPACAAAGAMWH